HQRRIGTGDLHGDRTDLAAMIGAPLGFLRSPQARIRRDHFRHRVPRAISLAQLTERPIGDARHRCDDEVVLKNVVTDVHGIERTDECKSTARGADYNRSPRNASNETKNFCTRVKVLRAWHAFWGINARVGSPLCITPSRETKLWSRRTFVSSSGPHSRRFT